MQLRMDLYTCLGVQFLVMRMLAPALDRSVIIVPVRIFRQDDDFGVRGNLF